MDPDEGSEEKQGEHAASVSNQEDDNVEMPDDKEEEVALSSNAGLEVENLQSSADIGERSEMLTTENADGTEGVPPEQDEAQVGHEEQDDNAGNEANNVEEPHASDPIAQTTFEYILNSQVEVENANLQLYEQQLREQQTRFVSDCFPTFVSEAVVEAEEIPIPPNRPYLGGYRDKRNHVFYFHAAVQTAPKPRRYIDPSTISERDTQTVCVTNERAQAQVNKATQMTSNDVYVSERFDRVLEYSGSYETAEAYWRRMTEKVGG